MTIKFVSSTPVKDNPELPKSAVTVHTQLDLDEESLKALRRTLGYLADVSEDARILRDDLMRF